MKTLLSLSLFISLSASACPDLSGKWARCQATANPYWITDGVSIEVIKTSPLEINLKTERPYSNEIIIADGMKRTTRSSSPLGEMVQTSHSYCEGETLIHFTEVTIGGQPFADLRTVMQIEGERLIQAMSGIVSATEFKDVMFCE